MAHSLVVPVVNTSEYRAGLEHCDDITLLHCTVYVPYTPGVYRRIRRDLATLLDLHGGPLYALETEGDPRHPKFLASFGFRIVGTGQHKDTGVTTSLWMVQKGDIINGWRQVLDHDGK
jgi:hypothetical protein